MNTLKDYFNKHKGIILLFIASLVSLAYIIFGVSNQKKPSSPTPTPQEISYKNIIPGTNTQADLEKILGTPIATKQDQNQTVDEYQSSVDLLPHTGYFVDNTLTFFKEIISSTDKKDSSFITDVYGDAPNVLYNKSPNSSFNLYVYPDKGIAYVGHPDGTLLEIWYFEPMTIDKFITDYAGDYSKTMPTNNTLY
jgi:hypothetical protein